MKQERMLQKYEHSTIPVMLFILSYEILYDGGEFMN